MGHEDKEVIGTVLVTVSVQLALETINPNVNELLAPDDTTIDWPDVAPMMVP
jgi:hypothetical protein